MRHLLTMAVVSFLGFMALAATKPATKPAPSIEGVWMQVNGHKVWQWEFKDGVLIERTARGKIESSRSKYKADVAKGWLDWDGGPGIYKIEGDKLTVCYGGVKRPTKFDNDGGKLLLYEFRKQ